MAATMFKGQGTVLNGVGPAPVLVPHGLTVIPTIYFAIPAQTSAAVVNLNTFVTTADIDNVIITPGGGETWAANVVFDVFAWRIVDIADEVAALVNTAGYAALVNSFDPKQAAEPSRGISAPTGYTPVRTAILADVPVPGVTVVALAGALNAYMAAHLLDSPLEFSIDNPFVSGAFDDPAIPTQLILTSRVTDAQVCNVMLRMHHSLTR